MAGFGLCDRLVKRGVDEKYAITIFGEEPQPAYDRVNLSQLFAGRNADQLLLADREWYSENKIRLVTGRRIVGIDRETQIVIDDQGEATPYDQLVLATGSRAWVPPIPGSDLPGVFVYRTIDDLNSIKRHVQQNHATSAAVIGGGLLGLEAAKVTMDLSLKPTVIEMAPGLMPRQLEANAAKVLKSRVETMGVDVLLTRRTERIADNGTGLTIHFAGSDPLNVDIVIVAAGIRPRDELAEAAELETGKRGGFAVDDRLQTVDPNIFAIGECASIDDFTYGLVAPCYLMADTLVDRLAGKDTRFTGADQSAELKLLGIPVVALGQAIGSSPDGVILTHEDEHGYREVTVEFGRVVGAAGVGQWDDIATIRQAVDGKKRLWRKQRERFVKTGRFSPEGTALSVRQWPADATVCSCLGISRGALTEAWQNGATSAAELISATGASTSCGSCQHLVCELAGGQAGAEQTVAGQVVLVTSAVSLLLSILIAVLPPIPMADSVQSDLRWFDFIWRDNIIKQISGYSLLTISVLGMAFSLHKRTRFLKIGNYGLWRAVHTASGVAVLAGMIAHTGMRLGANLNLALALTFLLLTFVGAAAGILSGLENRLTGSSAMWARQWRPRLTKLHIWLLWPLPALIAAHIACVYWY